MRDDVNGVPRGHADDESTRCLKGQDDTTQLGFRKFFQKINVARVTGNTLRDIVECVQERLPSSVIVQTTTPRRSKRAARRKNVSFVV